MEKQRMMWKNMIETFLYLAQTYEQLNVYETDFKFSSQGNQGYKENYQRINKLCHENDLEVPYVLSENKAYFLSDSESISSNFVRLLGNIGMNVERRILRVNERENLFMRLVRNGILLKTKNAHPQRTKYGLEYRIDSNDVDNKTIPRYLNASFSLLYGSNTIQVIFDLISRPNSAWGNLTDMQKRYCSPSPNDRYKTVNKKITEIFGDPDNISIKIYGNPNLCFKRVKLETSPLH